MSRFRILAFGGFTAVTIGTAAVAYCKPSIPDNKKSNEFPIQHAWIDNWDFRDPQHIKSYQNNDKSTTDDAADTPDKKYKATATRHIILVRHGQYVHSDQGREFKVLTELGRRQAALTGERIKSLDINFEKIVISTMVRAQQTGLLIAENLPEQIPKVNCSLLEEGPPYPVVPVSPSLETYEWQKLMFEDHSRIEGAFRKYIHRAEPGQEKDSYELLVCHGNVIRYFVCRALQFPPEGWLRMSIANCGITWITVRPSGKVSIKGLGDVGHLPKDLITYN